MGNKLLSKWTRLLNSKREFMIYLVMVLWGVLGILAFNHGTNMAELAAYFVSLTGFVGSYIFGESKRQSGKSSIFNGGPNSKREVMMYIVILLWTSLGVFTIVKSLNLIEMSAYFAALTPFVGGYVLGETFKKEESTSEPING